MKHCNRLLIIVAVLIAAVPLGTGLRLLGDVRVATSLDLERALEQSQDVERRSATWEELGQESERVVSDMAKDVQSLARRKRQVRLQIGALLRELSAARNRSDVTALNQILSVRSLRDERENLSSFIRYAYLRHLGVTSGPSAGKWILRPLLGLSLGQTAGDDLRDLAVTRARRQLVESILIRRDTSTIDRQRLHAAAGALGERLVALRDQHARLIERYDAALADLERTQRIITVSAEELQEIARISAKVNADILRMQGELTRIDGRLRSRAERTLIQMGLREDRPDRFRARGPVSRGAFGWPATGRTSAGFHDAPYLAHFGIPHEGIDIVVPHGSPVFAAADGIVYLVRRGGATGYTYVLIGHRDGYATLYGHLSDVSVSAGDEVDKGQQIGLSGATPGTDGAGPMTTGPHLHFEVIVRGEHVDPRGVLP